MPMQRQIIQFTVPQTEYLKTRSTFLGITLSDLVRRIIDSYRGESQPFKDCCAVCGVAIPKATGLQRNGVFIPMCRVCCGKWGEK